MIYGGVNSCLYIAGVEDSAQNKARLIPHGTSPHKKSLESPRFVPSGANLAHFLPKSGIAGR